MSCIHWIILALFTAIFLASQDAWVKRHFSMIAVKRISILFCIVYGGMFFRERHISYRLIGTGLMVAGATVITLIG